MKKYLFIVCILILAGCNNQVEEVTGTSTAVPIAQVEETETAEPTPTNSPEPTATKTEMPTATATSTNTPTATATETPTSTPTNTPTPSATPPNTLTPAPTLPPVTNTPIPPPTPEIPLYPMTPIQPWNQGIFVNSVVSLHNSVRAFYEYHGLGTNYDTGFKCSNYWNNYDLWEHSPAFTEVPTEWQSRHTSYRLILNDLRILVIPISVACAEEGNFVTEEDEQFILDSLFVILGRIEQLEAAVLAG